MIVWKAMIFGLKRMSLHIILLLCSFSVTVYKYQGCDIKWALQRIWCNSQINERYYPRKQALLKMANARFNSRFKTGKIYEITIEDKIYIWSTWEELRTGLKGHLPNKNSSVYEYIDKNSTDTIKMELIVNASSADKKSLEAVENKHKGEFADRYGKRVLNKIQSKQNKKVWVPSKNWNKRWVTRENKTIGYKIWDKR